MKEEKISPITEKKVLEEPTEKKNENHASTEDKQKYVKFGKLSVIISAAVFTISLITILILYALNVNKDTIYVLQSLFTLLPIFLIPLIVLGLLNMKKKRKGLFIANITLTALYSLSYALFLVSAIDVYLGYVIFN